MKIMLIMLTISQSTLNAFPDEDMNNINWEEHYEETQAKKEKERAREKLNPEDFDKYQLDKLNESLAKVQSNESLSRRSEEDGEDAARYLLEQGFKGRVYNTKVYEVGIRFDQLVQKKKEEEERAQIALNSLNEEEKEELRLRQINKSQEEVQRIESSGRQSLQDQQDLFRNRIINDMELPRKKIQEKDDSNKAYEEQEKRARETEPERLEFLDALQEWIKNEDKRNKEIFEGRIPRDTPKAERPTIESIKAIRENRLMTQPKHTPLPIPFVYTRQPVKNPNQSGSLSKSKIATQVKS